jgi:hypothetical protein
MNRASGTSLPTVMTLTMVEPWRTPSTLTQAKPMVSATRKAARSGPVVSAGQ